MKESQKGERTCKNGSRIHQLFFLPHQKIERAKKRLTTRAVEGKPRLEPHRGREGEPYAHRSEPQDKPHARPRE